MAKLTKSQQEELDRLQKDRDMARALSWPNFDPPPPMKKPDDWNAVIEGWAFNVSACRVWKRWQKGSISYNEDPRTLKDEHLSGSRHCDPLYATEQEAYLALYHATCLEYAKNLAHILKKAVR
jgi:hypothetical protein